MPQTGEGCDHRPLTPRQVQRRFRPASPAIVVLARDEASSRVCRALAGRANSGWRATANGGGSQCPASLRKGADPLVVAALREWINVQSHRSFLLSLPGVTQHGVAPGQLVASNASQSDVVLVTFLKQALCSGP